MPHDQSDVTLDSARERFRDYPSAASAQAYRETATAYCKDEMIEDGTLAAILDEIRKAGF